MEDIRKCIAAALSFISKRMKTEAEIRKKLGTKYCEETIRKTIAYLKEKGLVNDENYITYYVRDRIKFNPMGRLRIKKELELKGIDKSRIENNEEYSKIDEKILIDDILSTKLFNYNMYDEKDLRKVTGYLIRRGFEYHYINNALRMRREKQS